MFHRALLIACFSLHYSSTSTSTSTSTSASTDLSSTNYQCGRRQLHDRAKRIVGGNVTALGQFPWMVYLTIFREKGVPQFSGASIIGRRWLLTAAHTVMYSPYRVVYHGYEGRIERPSNDRMEILDSNIEEIVAHPDFKVNFVTDWKNYSFSELLKTSTVIGDIALIKLRQPLNFSEHVQPICLPTHDRQLAASGRDTAFVAGWGGIRNHSAQAAAHRQRQKFPLFLRHVSVTLERAERDPFARTLFGEEHLRQILLAKQDGGSGSCLGDSGGPLMRKSTGGGGYWFQHGVVTYSFPLKVQLFPFKPCVHPSSIAGYTRISKYCDFIAQTTEGEVKCIDPDE